jgi:hypothetical protein
MTGAIPGVDASLAPSAHLFFREYPDGRNLVASIVRSGWTPSFFGSLERYFAAEKRTKVGWNIRDEWVLRARPPAEIAESFQIHVEVLFFVTRYRDFQARTVQYGRRLVDGDPRVSRDVLFVVTADDGADDKVLQIPRSEGVIPLTWNWLEPASQGRYGEKPLRVRMERFLYATDMFDVRIPVAGSRFFGRQDSLQLLTQQTRLAQPVGVCGLRKIGKTSLLRTFVDSLGDWASGEPAYLGTYLDFQSVPIGRRDIDYVLWSIGHKALQAWQAHPASIPIDFTPELFGLDQAPRRGVDCSVTFDSDLQLLFAWIRSHLGDARLVVVFDEIERFVPPAEGPEPGFRGSLDLLRYLRGLNQQDGSVTLVIAGANPYFAERSRLGEQENPLFNFVVKHYLAPLPTEEVRFMVQRLGGLMGVKFHHEAAQAVVEHAGGHPFLTRQLCSTAIRLLGAARPVILQRETVEAALGDFSTAQHSTFAEMLESLEGYPHEQSILAELASGDSEVVDAHVHDDPVSVEHLKGYGLVQKQNENWRFTIPLFREYVLRFAGNGAIRS